MGLLFRRRRKPGPVRVCHVTTSDRSLAGLYAGQHRYFVERGYEVWGAALPDSGRWTQAEAEGLRFHPVPMSRTFGVFQNLRGLIALHRFFRQMDFDVVEAGTFAGGILGMLAARLAGVPVRIFTLRGLGYEQARGLPRKVILSVVRWSCRLSSQVQAVSHELRRRCAEDRLCDSRKVRVVLAGSSNGIDLDRFTLTEELRQEGRKIRQEAGIPDDAVVVGTVARLKIAKGVPELVEAFLALQERWPRLWLLMVGGFETMHDPIPCAIRETIRDHPRIHHAGQQSEPERYYAAMDIFALPTHREGFCNTILEASAMELPVIASDTTGCRDPIDYGATGILVPVRDSAALAGAVESLLADESRRRKVVRKARRRVEELFDQRKLWPALEGCYRELLEAQNLSPPGVVSQCEGEHA